MSHVYQPKKLLSFASMWCLSTLNAYRKTMKIHILLRAKFFTTKLQKKWLNQNKVNIIWVLILKTTVFFWHLSLYMECLFLNYITIFDGSLDLKNWKTSLWLHKEHFRKIYISESWRMVSLLNNLMKMFMSWAIILSQINFRHVILILILLLWMNIRN